jgi:hypothetical protein
VHVDKTTTRRLEDLFELMAAHGYAVSTVDRNRRYLNQACQHALRQRRTKTNRAADVLLPAMWPTYELRHRRVGPAPRAGGWHR